MDSGYSRYMAKDGSKFSFLTNKKSNYVNLGDTTNGRITRQGNVGNNTCSLTENILLVDDLKHNLLSNSQLCNKCFKVTFESSHCIIKEIQNLQNIFIGHKSDNVYTINIKRI